MKKIANLIIIVGVLLCLYSCDSDPYAGKRPIDYPQSNWICKEYNINFSVGENQDIINAQMLINNESVPFTFLWSSLNNNVTINFEVDQQKVSLNGECIFGEKEFTIKINDTKGYYSKNQIVMTFVNQS